MVPARRGVKRQLAWDVDCQRGQRVVNEYEGDWEGVEGSIWGRREGGGGGVSMKESGDGWV